MSSSSSTNQGGEDVPLTRSSSLTRHSYQRVQPVQGVTMTSLNVQVPADDDDDIVTSTSSSGPRCLQHQFNNLPANTPTSGQRSAKRTPSSSPCVRNLAAENYSPRTSVATPSTNLLMHACSQFMIPADPVVLRRITSASRSLNQSINQTIKSNNCPSPLPPCSPSPSHQSTITRARSFRSIIHDDHDVTTSQSSSPFIGNNRVLPQSPFHATSQSMNQSPTLGSPFGSSSRFTYRSPSPLQFPPSPVVREQVCRPTPSPLHFNNADDEKILLQRSTDEEKPLVYTVEAPESQLPDAPFLPRKPVSSNDQTIKRTTSTTASTPISSPSSPPNVTSVNRTTNRSIEQSPDEDPEVYMAANFSWVGHKSSLIVSRTSDRGVKFISPITLFQLIWKHHDFKYNHFVNQSNKQSTSQSSRTYEYSDFGYHYDRLLIFDCRFGFEYHGGHIPGAYHIDSFDQLKNALWPQGMLPIDQSTSLDSNPTLPWSPRTLIVLHCEFSQSRAPEYYRFLRQLESDLYGAHTLPEMYVMQGGYREFHALYKDRFDAKLTYTTMIDERFRHQLRLAMKQRRIERTEITRLRIEYSLRRGTKRSMSCISADVDEAVHNQTNNRSISPFIRQSNTRSSETSEPVLSRTKSSLI